MRLVDNAKFMNEFDLRVVNSNESFIYKKNCNIKKS